jgi:GT2 family glycosyltransferase/peptidoglycan/xylan/chitin deacetylase (PgdA/CDA1 family)
MAPQLSVVIPTYNRREQLRACLDALAQQTQPASDFEVIVVVDGSTDGTVEMLEALTPPFSLHAVTQEGNSGYGAARNAGVEVASGTYLLFLDDDVMASPQLVSEHLRVQREEGGVGVIGPYPQSLPPGAGRFARAWAEMRLEYYDSLTKRTPTFTSVHTGNFSVSKANALTVGGFAEDLPRAVDIEFGYRLQEAGVRFVFAPEALGIEDQRESSTDMFHDAEVRGANGLELWRRHPAILTSMRLGGYFELSRPWIGLRLLLLKLHVPPRLLDLCGYLIPRAAARRKWYGFVYNYCFWRGVRRAVPDRETWNRLSRGTPILMYHSVAAKGERAGRYVLPVRRFERQMRLLERRGYKVIALEELLACLQEHRLPPYKAIVLTFDDGYLDNRELAAPILERFGYPATFFLVSAAENGARPTGERFSGRQVMSPDDAKELVGGVVRFGAHTRTHPDLTSLALHEAQQEVAGSRADLEEALGVPITIFSYPYGKTNAEIKEIVRNAGFVGACGVTSGRNRLAVDQFQLKRLEIRGRDSLFRFALTLWMGDTHTLFQRLRT